ncbi:carbohydrate-binding family 9-like protein [candidate division KSB1 bacterium]|nr:carbohydrate-binding family 9-like protein [candidate division KSB1 bacterium]
MFPLKLSAKQLLMTAIGCFLATSTVLVAKMPIDTSSTGPFPEPKIAFAPRQYVCYRAATALRIDGQLTEKSWEQAAWTTDFIDIEGDLKPLPRFKTHAKMLWDDEYFYIAAELEEPHVWATLKKRDSIIFLDNDFEIFIDPDGDTHHYYELEINALGTEWDLFLPQPYRDQGQAIFAWDIQGLKTAVAVNGTMNDPTDQDQSWTVEIALPWEVLRECATAAQKPRAGDQWRVNFSRVEWQIETGTGKYQKVINPATGKPFPEDNWVWSPQGLINMHYPEMWGYVQFSDKIAGIGTEPFVSRLDNQAQWVLRQIYYREISFFRQNRCFSENLTALGIAPVSLPGYEWPPQIRVTWNLFEAFLKPVNASAGWRIRQDGRIWK